MGSRELSGLPYLSTYSTKSVTKKSYADLPTTFGESLGPLEEITQESDLTWKRKALEEIEALKLSPAPKRKRRRRTVDEDSQADQVTATGEHVSDNVELAPAEHEITEPDAVSPPKRKRKPAKPKAKPPSLDASETSTSSHIPIPLPDSPLAVSVLTNLALFPHCILLTRVGQFYESYFTQAPLLARLLSIKLTSRPWGGQRIPMCGFPLTQLDRYLKVLVQTEKRFVAMCEEFPKPGEIGGFERRVTRVVTPGTLIDESFLNQYENNYLLAIATSPPAAAASSSISDNAPSDSNSLGLAWIDVSTGEFFTQHTSPSTLTNDVARIAPKEVVLPASLRGSRLEGEVRLMLGEVGGSVSFVEELAEVEESAGVEVGEERTESDDVPSPSPVLSTTPPEYDTAFTLPESLSIQLLTRYLRTNLLALMPRLSTPIRETHEARMQIDAHTIRALEIREGGAEGGGVTGSLLSVVKRTVTTSGTRLLARWLCSPSTSLPQIEARQSLVALFSARPHLRADVSALLHRIEDASRIVQRFLLGRGDAFDLLAIRDTIAVSSQIRARIEQERRLEGEHAEGWGEADVLMERMRELGFLQERIEKAVDEGDVRRNARAGMGGIEEEGEEGEGDVVESVPMPELPTEKAAAGTWTMKPEFSEELQELHGRLTRLKERKDELEIELKRNFSAPSLRLHSSYNHGLHIRIGNPRRDSGKIGVSKTAVMIGQSGSSKSFFYPAWSQLGADIADAEVAIQQAERRAFESLRSEVNAHATSLRRNARIVDELDVTIGFANAADELRLIRPVMNESASYYVKNGRHPTVELGLLDAGRVFTPNTVHLSPSSRLHLITGPNMAGKSTLLRQTALIAILAQAGSFVPADHAEIGIVDKVFSRVGAKDDLFRDRSTFMVEMLETAEILRGATERSLVIMDEVGRGTTVVDGLAIAFATIEHLYRVNGCRALFATHFHELADMLGFGTVTKGEDAGPFPEVGFFCTDVDELEDGHFAYSHRLRPGVNRDSHGLKVARLAGMPEAAMEMAAEAMRVLRDRRAMMGSAKELRSLGQALAAGVTI